MENSNIRRGDTFIQNNTDLIVAIYESNENTIALICYDGMKNVSHEELILNYSKIRLDNYFYINDKVDLFLDHQKDVTSMNGNNIFISKGSHINQVNDIYVKTVEDLLFPEKRYYVFDFDTTGRDYVEYIADYKKLKLL